MITKKIKDIEQSTRIEQSVVAFIDDVLGRDCELEIRKKPHTNPNR